MPGGFGERHAPKPAVEGWTGDPVVPAGVGDVAGHLLSMANNRQTMLH